MNINWKIKSYIFFLLDKFNLYSILYFIQKKITKKSIPIINSINQKWLIHQNNLSLLKMPKVIEFGAGKNLAQNIYLSQFVQSQLLVDIKMMIDIDLVNYSFQKISQICHDFTYYPINNINDLNKILQIKYIAPFDFTNNNLIENSFDACISTDTIEHIPVDTLKCIFIALKKIIRPYGLISMVIDYSDHYSHTDLKISPLNFLKFNHINFQKYNHTINFQNRLRHYDYRNLFLDLGFRVLENQILSRSTIPNDISTEFNRNDPSITATQGYYLIQVIK